MQKIIETPSSWLGVQDFPDHSLVENVVQEALPRLLQKPEIIIFGKVAHQQRNVGFFSDESIGYHYSNQLARSQPLTSNMKKMLESINTIFGENFNGILINEYPDGTHTIGKHSDDESTLGKGGVIAISYGTPRTFRVREKSSGKIVKDIPTKNFEILQMGGDFQKEFTHEIPVQKKIKESRVSLTFRKHLN